MQKEEDSINLYEITDGSGSKVFCGLEVILQIYTISNNNLTTFPSKVSDVTLKIGRDDLKEVGLGVIGMKQGGERVVPIANDNKVNFNSYCVKMIEVKDIYRNKGA